MTWLIAEDEPDIRELVAAMCQIWGHTTLTFESGGKVWDWLDRLDSTTPMPELVLMDIRMPGKFGNEVARRMRSLDRFVDTPIILMTAFSLSESEKRQMMDADGVDYVLYKPLPDFDDLRDLLYRVRDRKRAGEEPNA